MLAGVLALLTAACGGGDPSVVGSGEEGGEAGESPVASLPVPTFAAGSAMAAIAERGKLVVGTKFDQPGFGLKNPTSGTPEGFDVEIAQLVAAALFGGTPESAAGKIEFVETVTKNREPFIETGKVDMAVATYTITDARKEIVDFAGPYFAAQQDIMVKADDTAVTKVDDLNGKTVCTVSGSTSEKNLRAKAPSAEVVLFDTYSVCAEALGDGRVQAVTTDSPILIGLANASNGAYKLVRAPFSEEPYGIGVSKSADDFRAFINDRLEAIYESGEWVSAFEATLGELGLDTPAPPPVNRYP
ncbi:MAG: glutamate ABC transporter substrate-binding protein [Acidimicrobiales bacterium]